MRRSTTHTLAGHEKGLGARGGCRLAACARLLVPAAALAFAVVASGAQNALDAPLHMGPDQSRALDRNLGVGTGRINQAAPQQDYRARNLVVTGDVAGGRGFRGSVGYRAEDDFAAPTSQAATIQFRRDSAYSNPLALNTSIANDRFALATGIGSQQYMSDYAYTRMSAMGLTGVTLAGRGLETSALGAARARLDLMTVLSTNSASLAAATAPSTVRAVRVPQLGAAQIMVSPFTGVVLVPDGDPVDGFQGGVYGGALMRDDVRSGRLSRADYMRAATGFAGLAADVDRQRQDSQLLEDARAASAGMARLGGVGSSAGRAAGADSRVDAPSATDLLRRPGAYDDVLRSVRERYNLVRPATGASEPVGQTGAEGSDAPAPGSVLGQPAGRLPSERQRESALTPERESISRAVRALRDRFMSLPGLARADTGVLALPGTEPAAAPALKPSTGAATAEQEESPGAIRPLSLDETLLILRHGTKVERLDSGSKDAMDQLLRLGSDFMGARRYFRAEDAFRTASVIAPASPMPLVGLASAQVGCGVQLAAAITLRRLLTDFPEMIDVMLAPSLQCDPQRMREVAQQCVRFGRESSNASDFGLVAAWCGHQLGDRGLVESGLAMMESADAKDPLAQALRALWLSPDP
jgi:hypothetical protein